MANENNIKPWSANKHYKVREVASYLSANWRNDTGHNSEPGLNSDWFKIKEATTPGAQSGLSTLEGAYNFSTLTSGDPGSGKALLNNADPLIATAVHISNTDNNGKSNNYHLLDLKAGDLIALNDKSTGKKYLYRLINSTTDETNYTTIPVILVEVVGAFADTDELVTEAVFTGGVEVLRQKTVNGNYTLTADDDKYYIYLELVANAIITVDSSALVDGFVCEFENLSDFEAKFIGDISPVESTNDPIYLVGDTLNKDDSCVLRRVGTSSALRLKGQLTTTVV